MNNLMKALLVAVLVFALAACGKDAEPKTATETPKKDDEVKVEELTVTDVYNKSLEAYQAQKSVHSSMEIEEHSEIPAYELVSDSKVKSELDVTMNPATSYQLSQVDMGEMGAYELEVYRLADAIFAKDPFIGDWVKYPNEMFTEAVGSLGGNINATLDLNWFKDNVEDFTLETTDTEYILTLDGSGEKFNSLYVNTLKANAPAYAVLSEDDAAIIADLEANKLAYTITVNKETFLVSSFVSDIDLKVNTEGNEFSIVKKVTANLSKYDEVETIEVPQEIQESAFDMTAL